MTDKNAVMLDLMRTIEKSRLMLLKRVRIDSSTVRRYDLGTMLRSLSTRRLTDMYKSFVPRGVQTLLADEQNIDVMIDALTVGLSDAKHITSVLCLFAPHLVDVFAEACKRKNGVPLDSVFLFTLINALSYEEQIMELSLFQLFGLAFIVARKPALEELVSGTHDGGGQSVDFGKLSRAMDFDNIDMRLIVPEEVRKAYKACSRQKREDVLDLSWTYYVCDSIARAAAHLYGAVSLDDLADIYNHMLKAKRENLDGYADADAELLRTSLKVHSVVQKTYFVDSYKGRDYVISTSLMEWNDSNDINADLYAMPEVRRKADKDALASLLENQRGKKPYIPEFREFLSYTNTTYFEQTEQVDALRRLVKPACSGYSQSGERWTASEQREDLLLDLHKRIQCNYNLQGQLDTFEDCHIKLERVLNSIDSSDDKKALKVLVGALTEMSNNTRLWTNRGWTPNELHKTVVHGEPRKMPQSVELGPNILKMLSTGEMSAEEMRKAIWSMDSGIPASVKADMLSQLDGIAPRNADTPVKAAPEPGRNAPCPCGSGKKYKNCCGKNK